MDYEVLDVFLGAYIEAALFSEMDESDEETGGNPLDDNYDPDDIAPETVGEMVSDCIAFLEQAGERIGERITEAGHDFLFTRNRHGVGFWDGDWPDDDVDFLTDLAHSFGEYNLYVGDDGKLWGGRG